MVLFDLADESWFPLVLVIVIGAGLYLLYRSMRHEIGKIQVPEDQTPQPEPQAQPRPQAQPEPQAQPQPQSPDDAGER